jgi:hypothetical protein
MVDRTRAGLGLMALAVLLSWIPIIELVGFVIGAIAAILLVLGAPAFGPRHGRLVWAAVILFVGAEITELVLFGSFSATISNLPSGASGPETVATVLAAFDTLIVGSLVVASIVSVCFALIAFELEDPSGRVLLIGGVVTQILVSVSLFVLVLNPLIHQAVAEAFASSPPDMSAIVTADAQLRSLSGLRLLNSIPAVFFAGAYAWALHRASGRATPLTWSPSMPESRAFLTTIVALIVLVSAAGAVALVSGVLPVTPSPPPSWQTVTSFFGDTTGTTENFTITGSSFQFQTEVTDNGPGGYSFYFKVYFSGTTIDAGGCGQGSSGPGTGMGGCGGFHGPGSFYITVTYATGVTSWKVTVEQFA